jgi:hypothetical protein
MPHTEKDTYKRKGICFRCMFGEHRHCYVAAGESICQCNLSIHDLPAAKVALGMDANSIPPKFPEEPASNDRFFFLPPQRILVP